MTTPFVCYVNTTRIELAPGSFNPAETLLTFLRARGLTGTKLGCGEGGCGACTVTVTRMSGSGGDGGVETVSVNACLTPVAAVYGCVVTTVEGIGNAAGPAAVQRAIAEGHGSQCGFCTPGIVMSMYALLAKNASPSEEEVEHAFDGNLCRCTGYRPILQAFRALVRDGAVGDAPPAFPDELAALPPPPASFPPVAADPTSVSTWHTAATLADVVALKAAHPEARLVIGNSELGVEAKFKHSVFEHLVGVGSVPELNVLQIDGEELTVGGSVTLARLDAFAGAHAGNALFDAIRQALRWFAGSQIRNVASVAGNVMTASPISDLNPLWMAMGARVNVTSGAGDRSIAFSDLFTGYRKTAVRPEEVLVSLSVRVPGEHEYVCSYKQAKRREDDIAIVGASFRVALNPETGVVESFGAAYGGMAAWTTGAPSAVGALTGAVWSRAAVEAAVAGVQSDLALAHDAPGGMASYRCTLAGSFLFKFFVHVAVASGFGAGDVGEREASAAAMQEHSGLSSGRQVYASSTYDETCEGGAPSGSGGVHMPQQHASALVQATGEAQYVDDIPVAAGSLFAAPVLSQVATGVIVRIETGAAEAFHPSVVVVTAADVPEYGDNVQGPIVYDEEVLVSKEITSQGQLLGMVAAASAEIARAAARLVEVVLAEERAAPVVTIDEAIRAGSYIAGGNFIEDGDVDGALAAAEHVVRDEVVYVGGQEHFYLETFAALVVPAEGTIKVWASTQNPSKTQKYVSRLLDVPSSKVAVHVKRVGGGFGGKETRTCPITGAVALVAMKARKAVRCMLDRDEDMMYMGTRHPYKGVYSVGFDANGVVSALSIDLYSNAGYSLDLSGSVMDRALFHVDNAYKIPNVRARGWLCKTNTPSNTAFRGFGAPQSMLIAEAWMDRVAREVGKDAAEVRAANFYGEGAVTHYGQALVDNRLGAVWSEVLTTSEMGARAEGVAAFNAAHRWRKRGLAAVPTKFGMSFTAKFLNQAGALVHVYQDGTVLVSHGAIEMGQGVHTKIQQIAATAFDIDVGDVFVDETATDKVANTVPTAASVQSDLNGMAVLDACEQIVARLAGVPGESLAEKAAAAHLRRINLSANGFYKTPDIGYAFEEDGSGRGMAFNYYNYGASVAEVEIDVLTGDHVVRRVDLVMDVGDSINPAIDVGQVEGAFVQGMGLFTMEELIKFPGSGHVFTRGPSTYKIPAFSDIPAEFNVALLKDAPNSRAIHSSKGVGEPPLFLAASVFFALKDAVAAARADAGADAVAFAFHAPATAERIRLACGDEFVVEVEGGAGDELIGC